MGSLKGVANYERSQFLTCNDVFIICYGGHCVQKAMVQVIAQQIRLAYTRAFSGTSSSCRPPRRGAFCRLKLIRPVMVATAARDDDLVAHAKKAWEFFRSIGSPKYHVAPMVDQVAPNTHKDSDHPLKAC